MNTDLDSRIADLQKRREISGNASQVLVSNLEQSVKNASQTLLELEAKTDKFEQRLGHLSRAVTGGVFVTLIVAILVIALAMWMGARVRSSALEEADTIKEQNAAQIAQIRQNGEREIAEIRAAMSDQRQQVQSEVAEAGAELAAMTSELEAGRSELAQFIALKERAGFNLFDHHGRTVIIVAEGREIRSWRVPGLSNLARYNGHMYQVFD